MASPEGKNTQNSQSKSKRQGWLAFHHHLCAGLISPHASSNVILISQVEALAVASVIEIDIEAGKDVGKKLLVGVEGFCQTDTGRRDRIGRQRCQEGGRVRVIHHGQISPNLR